MSPPTHTHTHTRTTQQGPPNEVNCHPHMSTPAAEFTVVHNGIITNCRALRALLERKGCVFVSETDTESIAKLVKYVRTQRNIVIIRVAPFCTLAAKRVGIAIATAAL